VVAVATVPCAAYARAGDDSTANEGARADPSDGGPGGGNRRAAQNQHETQRAADPFGRSDTILSPSQEQDLINRGWPR
jgi:hypothetical protein